VVPERQLQAYVYPEGKEREKEKKTPKIDLQNTHNFPENLVRHATN
jgi:hypothetical protein